MTRLPCPSRAALSVPDVYHSRSWLLTLSPVSKCHLPVSTPAPAGPSKSSVKDAAKGCPNGWAATEALPDTANATTNKAARPARVRRGRERRREGVTVDHLSDFDAPS